MPARVGLESAVSSASVVRKYIVNLWKLCRKVSIFVPVSYSDSSAVSISVKSGTLERPLKLKIVSGTLEL